MTAITTDFLPKDLDLYIEQGDDFSKIITLQDSSGVVDLAGYTVDANLRQYFNSTKDFNLQAEIYGSPVNGQIRVFLLAANSLLLVNPRYVYSVRLISSSNTIRVLTGQVIVSPAA